MDQTAYAFSRASLSWWWETSAVARSVWKSQHAAEALHFGVLSIENAFRRQFNEKPKYYTGLPRCVVDTHHLMDCDSTKDTSLAFLARDPRSPARATTPRTRHMNA